MPYASPLSSPVATIPFPTVSASREETPRPPRHHNRSFSSDSVPNNPNSGFIYVQPKASGSTSSSRNHSNASSTSSSPPSSGIALSKPRRTKIFGFTPTSGEATFMAKEHVVYHDEPQESIPSNDNPTTPPSLIPIPLRPHHLKSSSDFPTPSPSSDHVNLIKDSFPRSKTPMLRKKSGELVRSSLKIGDSAHKERPKTRSAPATPTFDKRVHFDTKLEHVKHFLAQQKPEAVSRSGSPVETETEDEPEAFPFPAMAGAQAGLSLRLPNFPSPLNHDQDVYLETLEIAPDGKSLKGIVRVKNLAFEKWVAIRFTLDNWSTVSEVSADHHQTMTAQSDRFVFHIRLQDLLAKIEEKTMFIAIRYTVGGREIWDNNGGSNYHVAFTKNPTPTGSAAPTPPAQRKQGWSTTNQDKKMAELRRELDRLVADDLDSSPLRSVPAFSEAAGLPTVFSSRYDFGTSLKRYSNSQATNTSPPKPRSKALPPVINTSTSSHPPTLVAYNPTSNSDLTPRPPSQDLYPVPIAPSLYSGYQPAYTSSHEVSHNRYHTYPATSSLASSLNPSPQTSYRPLLPVFGDNNNERKESPFVSPSTSPPSKGTRSPPHRQHHHHQHSNSNSSHENYSPSTSTSASSTYSPDSETNTSLGSSPPSATHSNGSSEPGSRSDFSSFLDRYCFHTSSPPTSALGLTGPSLDNTYPIIPSSSTSSSLLSESSFSMTPRRPVSLLTPTPSHYNYYSGGSSGASTPLKAAEDSLDFSNSLAEAFGKNMGGVGQKMAV